MRYLIMSDIEGVTGITTFDEAERSQLGRDMLMNDLLSVIEGVRSTGEHEIILYDMHTDGRNIDLRALPADIPVVVGKPINAQCYRGVGGHFDGLMMVGLHARQHEGNALLEHTYLRDYNAIYVNDQLVGEIGMEALLAGEQGTPLLLVTGDDRGLAEARALVPGVETACVKKSLGLAQALCEPPARTRTLLREAAARAVGLTGKIAPLTVAHPVRLKIDFAPGDAVRALGELYPDIFVGQHRISMQGSTLLSCWSDYLLMERRMIEACRSKNK